MLKKIENCDVVCFPDYKNTEITHLLLCGVGSFDPAIQFFKESSAEKTVNQCIKQNVPTLGICLGAQLLGLSSEEGRLQGLSAVSVKSVSLKRFNIQKIPHVGWNYLSGIDKEDPLLQNVTEKNRFYFSHSYGIVSANQELKKAEIGNMPPLIAVYRKDKIWGVQFHPEKSQGDGFKILGNFLNIK